PRRCGTRAPGRASGQRVARTSAACFGARSRSLGTASRGGLGLFAAQLAGALEALLALVFAQDASFIDTCLEPSQQLIERLAFASFNVHSKIQVVGVGIGGESTPKS